MSLVLAFAIGIIAGLRSMTAPAIVSLGARLGWISLAGTSLAFLGSRVATGILLIAMFAELVADKLPSTPNRTKPGPFVGRILTGALAGAGLVVGVGGSLVAGVVLGGLGGAAGTVAGYQARSRLVRALGTSDHFVAVGEDLIAIGGALLIVALSR